MEEWKEAQGDKENENHPQENKNNVVYLKLKLPNIQIMNEQKKF